MLTKVFHLTSDAYSTFLRLGGQDSDEGKAFLELAFRNFDTHYELTATVDQTDAFRQETAVSEAFGSTQNITCHWSELGGVTMVGTSMRSTSVGDIIEVRRSLYRIAACGCEYIGDATMVAG